MTNTDKSRCALPEHCVLLTLFDIFPSSGNWTQTWVLTHSLCRYFRWEWGRSKRKISWRIDRDEMLTNIRYFLQLLLNWVLVLHEIEVADVDADIAVIWLTSIAIGSCTFRSTETNVLKVQPTISRANLYRFTVTNKFSWAKPSRCAITRSRIVKFFWGAFYSMSNDGMCHRNRLSQISIILSRTFHGRGATAYFVRNVDCGA